MPITVAVGSAADTKEYVPGGYRRVPHAGRRRSRSPRALASSARQPAWLGVGLVLLAVIVIAYLIAASFFGREGSLGRRCSRTRAATSPIGTRTTTRAARALAQTQILQRAVEATGRSRRTGASCHQSSRCSSRPTCHCGRPRRCSSTSPASSSSRCCWSASDSRSPRCSGSSSWPCIPPAILSYLGNRRRKQFESMLPDTLQLLAEHPARRLLAHAGRGGGVAGGHRADGPRAAAGRDRGSARPTARGGARRCRRRAWTPATSPGRSWPSASSARSAATSPSSSSPSRRR